LEMLEREQLIGRVEELRGEEAEKDERGDLVLVIGSEGEGSNASPLRGGSASALHAGSVLQRVPRVVVELRSGRAHVAPADRRGLVFSGGAHALRLLDAFERPRTVQEVVRVLQRRVRRSEGWISLVEALVRLFEGGVLREVKR